MLQFQLESQRHCYRAYQGSRALRVIKMKANMRMDPPANFSIRFEGFSGHHSLSVSDTAGKSGLARLSERGQGRAKCWYFGLRHRVGLVDGQEL